MCPPDPKVEEAADPLDDGGDLDALRAAGDVESLLALAKSHRARREMTACLDAYQAAAELGSPEGEFAVALFYMSGGVVPQNLKEGASRLRSAAEKGSIPARVYVANLYELGVHYKADPEKADVWYRSAARAAKIEGEPGTSEHTRALAELGAARHVLALVERGGLSEDEKARLMQRAKVHGYGLRASIPEGTPPANESGPEVDAASRPTLPTPTSALENAAVMPPRPQASTTPATPGIRRGSKPEADEPKAAKEQAASRSSPSPTGSGSGAPHVSPDGSKLGNALAAFGYALLFAAAGTGAAYAATLGARELLAQGHPLPGLGARLDLVFPIVLGVVGVLPTWLVYRLGAVLKALFAGGAAAAIGWIAWGTGQVALPHAARQAQALAFGFAGFLAALLVLGFFGGTKRSVFRASQGKRAPRGRPSG